MITPWFHGQQTMDLGTSVSRVIPTIISGDPGVLETAGGVLIIVCTRQISERGLLPAPGGQLQLKELEQLAHSRISSAAWFMNLRWDQPRLAICEVPCVSGVFVPWFCS